MANIVDRTRELYERFGPATKIAFNSAALVGEVAVGILTPHPVLWSLLVAPAAVHVNAISSAASEWQRAKEQECVAAPRV